MFEQLIRELARALDEAAIPYIIIGGQAVLVYGSPRLTRDIDVTLGIDSDQHQLVQRLSSSLGLKILPEAPARFAEQTKVLPCEHPQTHIRVDFIFSCSPYETEAMDRHRVIDLEDQPVKFASLEDVIIHKMIAGRAIDHEDVKNMITKNMEALDRGYVERWLKEFAKLEGYKNLPEQFSGLMERTL